MDLLTLIIVIAVTGFLVWAIATLIPMPQPFKTAIYVVAVAGLIYYLLNVFHIWHGIPRIKIS